MNGHMSGKMDWLGQVDGDAAEVEAKWKAAIGRLFDLARRAKILPSRWTVYARSQGVSDKAVANWRTRGTTPEDLDAVVDSLGVLGEAFHRLHTDPLSFDWSGDPLADLPDAASLRDRAGHGVGSINSLGRSATGLEVRMGETRSIDFDDLLAILERRMSELFANLRTDVLGTIDSEVDSSDPAEGSHDGPRS